MPDVIDGNADGSIPGPHTCFCDANQIHDAITLQIRGDGMTVIPPSMDLSKNGLKGTIFFNTEGKEI